MKHEDGRIVLEHGSHLQDWEPLVLGKEDIGAVRLAQVSLVSRHLLEDKRIGPALDQVHVQSLVAKIPAGQRLVETTVLRFGYPVQLDADLGPGGGLGLGLGRLVGRLGAARKNEDNGKDGGGETQGTHGKDDARKSLFGNFPIQMHRALIVLYYPQLKQVRARPTGKPPFGTPRDLARVA